MLGKKNKEVKIETLLGKGSELQGNFSAPSSARIDGKVAGNVKVEGALVVGATGSISGDVIAESVLIGGEVLGNISAPEKAELTATAKVLGDIATKVIVIDENAVFQGKIDMNQEVPEQKVQKGNALKKPENTKTVKRSAKAALADVLREVAEKQEQDEESADKQEETGKADWNTGAETVTE